MLGRRKRETPKKQPPMRPLTGNAREDSRGDPVEREAFFDGNDFVELPIDGTLDLHTFHPRDVKNLVPEYLAECRSRGILQVRIIHGKGTGALREMVHAVLDGLPGVVDYGLGGPGGGEWGATIVQLSPDSG